MNWLLVPIPFLLPVAVHLAYQPLNENWTVRTFGCGCPPLDLSWRFNANHFNLLLWLVVFAGCGMLLAKVFPRESLRGKSGSPLRSLAFVGLAFLCLKLLSREIWF